MANYPVIHLSNNESNIENINKMMYNKKSMINLKYNKSDIKTKRRHTFAFWSRKVIRTGGHLGRKPYKVPTPRLRHSFIDAVLLGSRENLMLINTSFTIQETNKGLFLAAKILRRQGKLLIVDTRGDISPFLEVIENKRNIIPSAISLSGSRWVGGTVSNWKMISQMVSQYAHISKQFHNILSQNDIQSSRYIKMKASYPGFLENKKKGDSLRERSETLKLKKKPDLIFVVNPNESRHIIQEAVGLKIPVVALVDSNTNLDGIKIPIPINYDTMFWVYHCVNTLVRLAHCVQVYNKTGLSPLLGERGDRPSSFKERKAIPGLGSLCEAGERFASRSALSVPSLLKKGRRE
jgi:small subunit ribosomal protein S2